MATLFRSVIDTSELEYGLCDVCSECGCSACQKECE
jgi:hypothetical protein